MAIVAYFPERNVEANSSIDFGRILPKRLAPLERTIVVNQAEMWDKYRYTHKSQLKQNMFKEKKYIYINTIRIFAGVSTTHTHKNKYTHTL